MTKYQYRDWGQVNDVGYNVHKIGKAFCIKSRKRVNGTQMLLIDERISKYGVDIWKRESQMMHDSVKISNHILTYTIWEVLTDGGKGFLIHISKMDINALGLKFPKDNAYSSLLVFDWSLS